ncbi:MAG: hypothetical protein RIQ33_1236 [Bacteroidota bacterium]|jgi:hypothetical protein
MKRKILFILLLFAFKLQAQELSAIHKEKPFRMSGSITGTVLGYGVDGIAARYAPATWMLNGNLTPVIYGMAFPISATVSEQQRSYNQPFNQYGVRPTYKWMKFYLGYNSMTFNAYTLGGSRFLGGGLELNPGVFRFGAMYGRFKKAITYDSLQTKGTPTFERWGWATKIGIGKSQNYFDLIFSSLADKNGSIIIPATDVYQNTPKQNKTLGYSFRFTIMKHFYITSNAAASLMTENTRNDSTLKLGESNNSYLKQAQKYQTVNASTHVNAAGDAAIGLNYTVWGVSVNYKRIDPTFSTLGAYYFQQDIQSYTIAPNFNAFKQKLQFNGSFGLQYDNVLKTKAATTESKIYSANVNIIFSSHYTAGLNFSNYGITQKAGLLPVTDSFRLALTNLNATMYHSLNFNNKTCANNFNINLIYQQTQDFNQYTNQLGYNNSNVKMASLSYGHQWFAKNMGYSVNANFTQNTSKLYEYLLIGPGAGFNKTVKKKIPVGVNANYQFSLNNGKTNGSILSGGFTAGYRIDKHHSLRGGLSILKNSGVVSKSFIEGRANLSYTYSF